MHCYAITSFFTSLLALAAPENKKCRLAGSILMAEKEGLLPLRYSDPLEGDLAYQNALALLVRHFSFTLRH